jgi:hypothetical protein
VKNTTISFRIFASLYLAFMGWLIAASLLGFSQFYLLASFAIVVMLLIAGGCLLLAIKIAKNVIQAPSDEIRREDDVLLQGTPFISTVLFFYINISITNYTVKLTLGLAIVLLTGTFYVLRALAKIKSNPELRFSSMFFLIYLSTAVIYEIVVLLSPEAFPWILTLPLLIQVMIVACLVIITFLPSAFCSAYFSKRYGVRPPTWLKKRKQ